MKTVVSSILLIFLLNQIFADQQLKFSVISQNMLTIQKFEEVMKNLNLGYPVLKSELRKIISEILKNALIKPQEDSIIIIEDKKNLALKISKEFSNSIYGDSVFF